MPSIAIDAENIDYRYVVCMRVYIEFPPIVTIDTIKRNGFMVKNPLNFHYDCSGIRKGCGTNILLRAQYSHDLTGDGDFLFPKLEGNYIGESSIRDLAENARINKCLPPTMTE